MDALGAADVVHEGEQEGLVACELRERALRRAVELAVAVQLVEKAARPALLREHGHAENDLPRSLVLGDRLQRLDVYEPLGHVDPTTESLDRLRRGCALERLDQLLELRFAREGDLEASSRHTGGKPAQPLGCSAGAAGERRVDLDTRPGLLRLRARPACGALRGADGQ